MITIILGMHRSGTSTVAGILHLNNIIMGTDQNFWPRPLPQNPKGFYENFDFRKINDKILNGVDYDVKSYESEIPIPVITDRLKKVMAKIILKNQSTYEHWGWKDPRSCLTIFQWIPIFTELGLVQEIKIIYVTRKAISVARSLKKRNDLPISKGISLWKTYTERSLSFCENSKSPIFYMSFEDLLQSPQNQCEKLFKFLGTDFDETVIDKFVDEKISTSGSGENHEILDDIVQIESKIQNLISL